MEGPAHGKQKLGCVPMSIEDMRPMHDYPFSDLGGHPLIPISQPAMVGDMLRDIMNFQNYFNSRVSGTVEQFEAMDPRTRSEWLSRMIMAANNEAEEMRAEVAWKWWKKNQDFDVPKARLEWIDRFHFVLSEALVLGMTPDMIFQLYMEKNKINHQRQDTGY